MQTLLWTSACVALAVTGCRTTGTDRRTNDDGQPVGTVNDDRAPRGRQGSIRVAERIRTACQGEVGEPMFEFDSANVTADAAQKLDALVRCFTEGKLRDAEVKLIGHTDPRGTEQYNHELGKDRAQNVAGYLVSKGMDQGRVQVTSEGESQASTVPSGWAADRVVEIDLVD